MRDLLTDGEHLGFTFQIVLWLWITVLFANFAEAVAEGRGKAQAATLRRPAPKRMAKRLPAIERRADYQRRSPRPISSRATSCWSRRAT